MTILDEGIRSFALEGETHDVDEKNHTVVVDFPFERLDTYRSDFGKGWCDEYLAAHRPVMVVHHNPRDLIGRMVPGGYQNLGNRAQIKGGFSDFDSVPLAKEYFAHIRDDEIPGWSYHYRNGRGIPHPSGQRAAVRYTKADMPEFGPTPFPAIPGAGAVGLRSEEPALSIPTLTEILQLKKDGFVNDEGVRALVEEHYPNMREHITLSTGTRSDEEKLAEHVARIQEFAKNEFADGCRAMTITIGDDGSVSTGAATDASGAITTDGADDPTVLVTSIDACLDEFAVLIGDTDVTTLPDNIQQAIKVAQAAGVAVDELQVTLGIEDTDDPLEGQRSEAEMDAEEGVRAIIEGKDRDELPDSDFAFIEDGGVKDGSGKTVPRSKRHFIIKDKEHVANALSRIGQGAKFSAEAKPAVEKAAKKFGIDADEGTRSEPEEPDQATAAAEALARLRAS